LAIRDARLVAILCAVSCLPLTDSGAQEVERRPATPLPPVTALLDAFAVHRIVALGEGPHNNEQGHAFRMALIRHPRFSTLVDDIVVESGSARHQDVMDRFVRGEQVASTALRDILEDTVGATPTWDREIYAEFFRAVRDVNRSQPRERQLRILLGDPPIDWTAVANRDDYRAWLLQRDAYPAAVIEREVIARGRRALVIYGDGHFQARSERPARSLTAILESRGTNVFIVMATFAALAVVQPDVASWETPALARLRGTRLGAAPYDLFLGPPPPTDYFRAHPRIEDHADAVLYLGGRPSMAPLSYPRCAEPDYIRMRVGRMVLSGSPPTIADRLAQDCEAAQKAAGSAKGN
jgi:hypothetical protein